MAPAFTNNLVYAVYSVKEVIQILGESRPIPRARGPTRPFVVGYAPIVIERCFWRRLTVLTSGTCQSRLAI